MLVAHFCTHASFEKGTALDFNSSALSYKYT